MKHSSWESRSYESEENYVYLKKQGLKPLIKPQTYEVVKKKSFRKIIEKGKIWSMNAVKDEYLCANNKKLVAVGNM